MQGKVWSPRLGGSRWSATASMSMSGPNEESRGAPSDARGTPANVALVAGLRTDCLVLFFERSGIPRDDDRPPVDA